MGFGWLMIGYFAVNIMALYQPLSMIMLIGYPMMIAGLFRLAPYEKRFHISRDLSFLTIPFAIYYALFGLSSIGILPPLSFFDGIGADIVEWCYFALTLALHALILWGIAELTRELSLFTFQSAALRNLIFVMIYHLLYLIISLPLSSAFAPHFAVAVMILRLLCVFLNLWLFFKCHRIIIPEESMILPADGQDAPKSKSKENT
ncbi:MAG: hypothetical protein E7663_00705 [Ruminococcaceae bacterium]|nr:hypothetical protein [Oscillospiraceae bacterium]